MLRSGMNTPNSKIGKQESSNLFDSDSNSESKKTSRPSRASSAPVTSKADVKITPSSYNEDEGRGTSSATSSTYSGFSGRRNLYKNDFRDAGGLENQTVQELESYAAYKAEETTEKVYGCVRIAEEIREDATKTLVTLHQQGEQISQTHLAAANIEHDLSRGEKLLGSLGGMFSKTWKPKKGRPIKGPVLSKDDSFIRRGNHLEQRERLGLSLSPKGRSNSRQYPSAPTSAMDKVQVEKDKQDDALSDLSNLVGELKSMAVDMGSEIGRQNTALDHFYNDVEEIDHRVKGVTIRGRHLLRK
ncbi:hypothetical protein QJS04_geneDACA005185 [Acorus gramineus]|uniref:t-SNARE coiled-coil homology domain-containing protein n=1 Tax=Acorus gramineus TaxID=55184 RepID=A0AAV9AUA3_ACOGR|nr:hypothetical protein QJS04_geneDACA005185 [Acorus gramineus]